MSGSNAISPTAHYTGQVWTRSGLSHPALSTREGELLFASLQPAMVASRALGGPSLEPYLMARHLAIDARVEQAIESGRVSQVLEVAAGLSLRGWRFVQRYGDRITYVEADLPPMAERKRRALVRAGSLGEHQGLLGYLSTPDMTAVWERFAAVLSGFSAGRYVSDLHLGDVVTPVIKGFRVLLGAFVRGRVYLHFDSAEQAERALLAAGFRSAQVARAAAVARSGDGQGGAALVHILEAST